MKGTGTTSLQYVILQYPITRPGIFLEPSDQFESQLEEILDAGPAEPPVVLNHTSPEKDTTPSLPEKNRTGTFELLIRIIGMVALVALLSGFALRISFF